MDSRPPNPDDIEKANPSAIRGAEDGSLIDSFGYAIGAIGFLLLVWQSAILIFDPPGFLLPSPAAVFAVFTNQSEYMLENAAITALEMVLGLVIGALAGVIIAVALSSIRALDRLLMPFVVATQTLPVFAIAPVLVIWFGLGLGSKIVMAALIIFFPVASAFYDGLKSTPRGWLDLGRSWGANGLDLFWKFRLPAAMPALMSGLKIAATLAPIGAVVGEWAGAAGGLGFVMLQANARTQMDVVFAALIVLALSAWLLRALVTLVARRATWWATFAYS